MILLCLVSFSGGLALSYTISPQALPFSSLVSDSLALEDSDIPLPWPRGTMTVYVEDPRYTHPAYIATTQWNRTEIGVKMVFIDNPSKADLLITSRDAGRPQFCRKRNGEWPCDGIVNWIGYRAGKQSIVYMTPFYMWKKDIRTITDTIILSHELGHVLGLGHQQGGCRVMDPKVNSPCAYDYPPSGEWRCGAFEDDAKDVARLYKVPPSPSYQPWCTFGLSPVQR